MTSRFIINHLWQSSCFALLAGLLAVVLRRNSPKVRYWVWLSASLKFLVPLALLVSLGSVAARPARHAISVPAPMLQITIVEIAEPFSSIAYTAVPTQAPLRWVPVTIGLVWTLGFLAITLVRWRSWLGVRAALRAGTPIELPIPVRALITRGTEEPGILGFLRPVLVLPAQLLEHLNPRQLGAILTHEMCHVRRRDNFFAAVHMAVEAVFWFNPLVWWIGSRMVEERELACDEEVLRLGCEPGDYFEGILKVCRFYTESPLPCISGVTGADVKKRLRAILAGSIADELTAGKKVALAAIGLAALVAPILIGVLNLPVIRAQSVPAGTPKWEAVSIRPCESRGSARRGGGGPTPGRLNLGCVSVIRLIEHAYEFFEDGQMIIAMHFPPIEGGPRWIRSDEYTITAKAESTPRIEVMNGPMLQRILEDRFKLKVHRETRDIPVYALTVAKGGPKLPPSKDCTPIDLTAPPPTAPPGQLPRLCGMSHMGAPKGSNLTTDFYGVSMAAFSRLLNLDRPIIDKTGITGLFDIHLEFALDDTTRGALPANRGDFVDPEDPAGGTSIFSAVQQQLGLKLEATKGPGEFLVVDSVERPSEN